MPSFCVKGVTIGEGRPKTVVSLMDSDLEGLLASAASAVEAGADCLEWRADFADDVNDPRAMAEIARSLGAALPHTPLIFTFRSESQGGRASLSLDDYEELVRTITASGCVDIVDLEVGVGTEEARELAADARADGVRTIVSHHDFSQTPDTDTMIGELMRMSRVGTDVVKLAVMAHDVTDCLRLMEATSQARNCVDVPLVTMAMGADGVLSRLAGEAVGSALTFCAVGTPSAPGQVRLERVVPLLGNMHEALIGVES